MDVLEDNRGIHVGVEMKVEVDNPDHLDLLEAVKRMMKIALIRNKLPIYDKYANNEIVKCSGQGCLSRI